MSTAFTRHPRFARRPSAQGYAPPSLPRQPEQSPASPRCSARTRMAVGHRKRNGSGEDGLIWVYGLGDDGVMVFTDFGIENPHQPHRDLQGQYSSAQAVVRSQMTSLTWST